MYLKLNESKESILAVSWNLHKGRSMLGMQVWSAMRSFMVNMPADVFFLQEAMARRLSSLSVMERFKFISSSSHSSFWHCQATELADAMNYELVLGQNVFKSSKRHGNAIISPHPLNFFGKWDISAHSFEKRGLLVATMNVLGKTVILLCVHLALTRKARIRQIHWLASWIKKNAPLGPLILSGDFNDWRNDSHRILEEIGLIEVAEKLGEAGLTFPAFLPKLGLDKMFVRDLLPLEWQVPDINMAWLSDHLPYIARLGFLK